MGKQKMDNAQCQPHVLLVSDTYHDLQHEKNKALEQRLEVLTTERDDAKILAKELKVSPTASVCSKLFAVSLLVQLLLLVPLHSQR